MNQRRDDLLARLRASSELEDWKARERDWLVGSLAASIAALGYPVGMGAAPHPADVSRAADMLLKRYATAIERAVDSALRNANRVNGVSPR